MKLYYYLDSKKQLNTTHSNSDLEIEETVVDKRTTIKIKALKDIVLSKAIINMDSRISYRDVHFLNGYQSWTDSFENKLVKRERNIYKSPHIITYMFAMDKYGDAYFYKYRMNKSHGFDVYYAKGENSCFLYNLNFKNAYLIIELIKRETRGNLKITSEVAGKVLKTGEEFTVFDYKFFDYFDLGLKAYYEDFPTRKTNKIFGYTSWYNYYQNINERIILDDLSALDSRFNLFQIDDGYETKVGDWLNVDPSKFPNGLKPIVDKIHQKGMKAGIWLAPFAGEKESELFKNHPELFVKGKNGKPFKTGGNWSGFYALDMQNEAAREHVKKSLQYYLDMGFDFFKLDFLYAAHLLNNRGKTRAEYAYEYYHFLREVLGDKIILGCGANILSSYDNFDYLRIGPDVSLSFDDSWFMRMFHRERISTKVTLQNTIYRSLFNERLFGNDPDVFLLRDNNIKLSKEQKHALITINSLFGSVLMTSDNIASYDNDKREELDRAIELFYKADNKKYLRKNNLIEVTYELNGEVHKFNYDCKRGVING